MNLLTMRLWPQGGQLGLATSMGRMTGILAMCHAGPAGSAITESPGVEGKSGAEVRWLREGDLYSVGTR